MNPDLGFRHVYQPGADPHSPTLLLLHGTGGDEHDMLPLGRLLDGANLLSPRGQVLEQGMPRFFRRLAEGVICREPALLHRRGCQCGKANHVADGVNVVDFGAELVVDENPSTAVGF